MSAPGCPAPPRFTAVVLAAARGRGDPLAESRQVDHKALLPVGGVPMVVRVLEALAASPAVRRIVIVIDDPAVLQALPPVARDLAEGRIAVLPSAATPASSVLQAAEALGQEALPLLVTTADSPLLTPQMLAFFCAESLRTGADVTAAAAAASVVRRAFPTARRTFLRFRDDGYSGCNLFAVLRPKGLLAVRFWTRLERHRKRPWRLAAAVGPRALALFLLRRLTLDQAVARLAEGLGLAAGVIKMPFAEAAMDVDKPADLVLAEAALRRRR